MALTIKQKEKFIDLRSDGLSFDSIAKKMGVAKNTLINLQVELEKETNNAVFLKLQMIVEKFQQTRIHKIEAHSKLLAKTMKEIEARDLSTLNFRELLALKESLEKNLKDELTISFITDEQVDLLLPAFAEDKTIPFG